MLLLAFWIAKRHISQPSSGYTLSYFTALHGGRLRLLKWPDQPSGSLGSFPLLLYLPKAWSCWLTRSTQQLKANAAVSNRILRVISSKSWRLHSSEDIFHFSLAYKVFNIFICLSIKPSVAVTGQNVDNENKCMLMEKFHEMLTRNLCTTRHVMESVSRETWETH